MSHELLHIRRKSAAAAAQTGAGAVSEITCEGPIVVTRVGYTVTVLNDTDNAVAFTATISRRVTLGSAAGAVALGVFSIFPANVTRAIGFVANKKAVINPAAQTGEDGKPRNVAPSSSPTPFEVGEEGWMVPPGQSIAFTLDTNAELDAGSGFFWIEYKELPWNGMYVDQATVVEDVTQLPS